MIKRTHSGCPFSPQSPCILFHVTPLLASLGSKAHKHQERKTITRLLAVSMTLFQSRITSCPWVKLWEQDVSKSSICQEIRPHKPGAPLPEAQLCRTPVQRRTCRQQPRCDLHVHAQQRKGRQEPPVRNVRGCLYWEHSAWQCPCLCAACFCTAAGRHTCLSQRASDSILQQS